MHTKEVITKRVAVIGIAGLFIYAITGPTTHAPAAAPPSPAPPQNVTVVNGTANPVPVVQQGGVTISGTPNVSIANTPNVNIANAAASPVPVRPVDSSTAHPISAHNLQSPGDAFFPSVYTVPAGKRLIVEHISAVGFVPTGIKPLYGLMFGNSQGTWHFLIPTYTATFLNYGLDKDVYVITQAVKYFVDAGDTLHAGLVTDSGGAEVSEVNWNITGYLVDAL